MNQEIQDKHWKNKERKKRRNPTHPSIAAFAKPKISIINSTISINKNGSLLDVGCGNGYFTYWFEQIYDTYGLDYSKEMLEMNPVNKKIIGNAENLPFLDNSFKIVFCSNLLHHLGNPQKVVDEMRRVSNKYIIILEPNRNNILMFLFCFVKKEERKSLIFNKDYISKLTSNSNLKQIKLCSTGLVFPNKTPEKYAKYLTIFDKENLGGAYLLGVYEK